MDELPIACTLTSDQRQARQENELDRLMRHARETQPVEAGYAFRFDPDDAVLAQIVDVIRLERTCCRFLRFELDVRPGGGPVWLRLTGPEGTVPFLADLLGL